MGNYSFKTAGLPEPVNGIVEGHNFTQGVPHTTIYEGQTGLTFRNCNLLNCDVPADSIIDSCLRSQVSFCSHLHEPWLTVGYISACITSCSHLTVTDMVTIDGVAIDTNPNYTYEDTGVA